MISLNRGVVIKSLEVEAEEKGQQAPAPEKSWLCHKGL